MLYETSHIRVTAEDGVATLWLAFPGQPVNALSPSRLLELLPAFDAIRQPSLEVLVIRSAKPAGFCGGYEPDLVRQLGPAIDPREFAAIGQRVFGRLATLPMPTVAFIEGPCLGPGLDLAVACDYRLAVAGPDSWVGWSEMAPCWGGAARLGAGSPTTILTAREAVQMRLFDDACSARRGRIELRLLLDQLLAKPRKRQDWNADRTSALMQERRHAGRPWPRFEIDATAPVERALRGQCVTIPATDVDEFQAAINRARDRGRVTPLEAEQALRRMTIANPPTRVERRQRYDVAKKVA